MVFTPSLAHAVQVALEAGNLIQDHFGLGRGLSREQQRGATNLEKEAGPQAAADTTSAVSGPAMKVHFKSAADLVTDVDVAVEKLVMQRLLEKYPNHTILGEESAESGQLGEDFGLTEKDTWVIDPIDGTSNFVHGMPLCCVSIGFWSEKVPVLGVIYNPALREMVFAEKGRGCWLVQVPGTIGTGGGASGLPSVGAGARLTKFSDLWNADRIAASGLPGCDKEDVQKKFSSVAEADRDPTACPLARQLHRNRPQADGSPDPDQTVRLGDALIGCGFLVGEMGKLRNSDTLNELLTKTCKGEQEKYVSRVEWIKQKEADIMENTRNLVRVCRDLRRSGSAACDMYSVAIGRLDAYHEFGVKEWDVAAGCVILTEAGCCWSTGPYGRTGGASNVGEEKGEEAWAGETGKNAGEVDIGARRLVAACNPGLLREMGQLLLSSE